MGKNIDVGRLSVDRRGTEDEMVSISLTKGQELSNWGNDERQGSLVLMQSMAHKELATENNIKNGNITIQE